MSLLLGLILLETGRRQEEYINTTRTRYVSYLIQRLKIPMRPRRLSWFWQGVLRMETKRPPAMCHLMMMETYMFPTGTSSTTLNRNSGKKKRLVITRWLQKRRAQQTEGPGLRRKKRLNLTP